MTRKILVFDDNHQLESTCDYMRFLTGWEFSLGAEAKVLDRLGRERFDLILLDLMIGAGGEGAEEQVRYPGVDPFYTGLEFLRRLRRGRYVQVPGEGTVPDVPVIAFTAVGGAEVEREMREQWGVQDFFDKPPVVADLVGAMKRILGE